MTPRCPSCLRNAVRNDLHDSYACKTCDRWTEPKCTHPKCQFCKTRPGRPSLCAKASWDTDK